MSSDQIPVKIIEEKPIGYLIELTNKNSTMIVPKKTFIRRVQRGHYEVENSEFLSFSL